MQYVTLFRFVEILLDAPDGASMEFLTDMPGDALAVRAIVSIPPTTGRHPYRMILPGSTKGKLFQIGLTPTNGVSIYKARVYARLLGPQSSPWSWHPVMGIFETQDDWVPIKLPIEPTPDIEVSIKLPIEATPDQYQSIKLPIEATSDEYSQVKLPIEPTPDLYQQVKVPILDTPDDYQQVKLPIEATPDNYQQLKLPVEATPDTYTEVKLPIETTGDAWTEEKLPVKPTPVVPEWVNVEVDE